MKPVSQIRRVANFLVGLVFLAAVIAVLIGIKYFGQEGSALMFLAGAAAVPLVVATAMLGDFIIDISKDYWDERKTK